ncbi:MAG TPA: hypothetical protein PKC73_00085 [Dermatophilaceae bacterium]|jgi:ABC-type amino acid transport substrate-binding protein|nr:hypothetical protein [Dermatophilaceae bacterium]
MNNLKKLFVAIRDDTDGARLKALKAIGIPVATFVAGIVLTKLNSDRVDVLVINETPAEELLPETIAPTTEF